MNLQIVLLNPQKFWIVLPLSDSMKMKTVGDMPQPYVELKRNRFNPVSVRLCKPCLKLLVSYEYKYVIF